MRQNEVMMHFFLFAREKSLNECAIIEKFNWKHKWLQKNGIVRQNKSHQVLMLILSWEPHKLPSTFFENPRPFKVHGQKTNYHAQGEPTFLVTVLQKGVLLQSLTIVNSQFFLNQKYRKMHAYTHLSTFNVSGWKLRCILKTWVCALSWS